MVDTRTLLKRLFGKSKNQGTILVKDSYAANGSDINSKKGGEGEETPPACDGGDNSDMGANGSAALSPPDIEVGDITLQRALSRWDGMALIISSMIGSGIFAAPGILLSNVGGDATLAMIVWVFGSILAACMGFVYAELGTLMPSAGGEYTYVKTAFGNATGFVWSFARYWVVDAADRGIVAFTCAKYLYGAIYPSDSDDQGVWPKKLIAIGAMAFVTILNCFKIKVAAKIFASFVSLKFLLVLLLAIFMVIQLSRSPQIIKENFGQPFSDASFKKLGPALIAAMWAYGGYNKVNYVGEELKNPVKDTAPAIIYSIIIVLFAYVTCNLSYFTALTSAEIMTSSVVATDTARTIVGSAGATTVSVLISVSVLGTLFNGVLQTARFGYATARDGQFPAMLGRLSKSQQTPYVSILIQGTLNIIFLAIPGSNIKMLLGFIKPVEWSFDLLLVAVLVKLRFQMPKRPKGEKPKTFKMPLYPVPLAVVISSSLYMIINSLMDKPLGLLGFVFTSLAFPIHYFFVRPRMRRKLALDDTVTANGDQKVPQTSSVENGDEVGVKAIEDTTDLSPASSAAAS